MFSALFINVEAKADYDQILTVFAVEDYNADSVNKSFLNTENATTVKGLSWDDESNTLTFENYDAGPVYVGYNVDKAGTGQLLDVNIVVKGKNTIHSMPNVGPNSVNATFAFNGAAANITGDGSLEIESSYKDAKDGYPFFVIGSLTLDGPSLTIKNTSDGITVMRKSVLYNYDFHDIGGDLVIKSGIIEMGMRPTKKSNDWYYVNNCAFYGQNSISITGGKFLVDMDWTEEETPKHPYGVFFSDNSIKAENAVVIAAVEESIGEIPAFFVPLNTSSDEISPDKVVVDDSTVITYIGGSSIDIGITAPKLSETSYAYDGKAKEPQIIIPALTEGVDYSVSYENNTNPGNATAVVTGLGWFSGTKSISFTISGTNPDNPGGDDPGNNPGNNGSDSGNANNQNQGNTSNSNQSSPGTQAGQTPETQTGQTPTTGSSVVVGSTITVNNAKYKIAKLPENGNNGEVEFEGVTNEVSVFVMPASISDNSGNYDVTSISDNAFSKNKKLRKVVIGPKVRKIGKKAFFGCRSLKRVYIKTKLLKAGKIGKRAFFKIHKKAIIRVPKAKKKLYTKLLRKSGLTRGVKIR
jgi:hypothetical protein